MLYAALMRIGKIINKQSKMALGAVHSEKWRN